MSWDGGRSSLFERLSDYAFRELMRDKPPRGSRPPSVIELERCPVCREWLPQRSKETGQCRACDAWIGPLVRNPLRTQEQ